MGGGSSCGLAVNVLFSDVQNCSKFDHWTLATGHFQDVSEKEVVSRKVADTGHYQNVRTSPSFGTKTLDLSWTLFCAPPLM